MPFTFQQRRPLVLTPSKSRSRPIALGDAMGGDDDRQFAVVAYLQHRLFGTWSRHHLARYFARAFCLAWGDAANSSPYKLLEVTALDVERVWKAPRRIFQ